MLGFTKRPLFLIAWKNLKTYPVRILLTTSSIILGVSVIIASSIFSESNKSAFDNLFSGIYEGIDLVVNPVQEDFAEGFGDSRGQGPLSFELKKRIFICGWVVSLVFKKNKIFFFNPPTSK